MVGILSSMVGVGGGFIMTPILILLFGLIPSKAIGTTLVMVAATSISGSLAFYRQRRIDFRLALVSALITVPAAYFGGHATSFLAQRTLAVIFGWSVLAVGIFTIVRTLRSEKNVKPQFDGMPVRKGFGMWSRTVVDRSTTRFEYGVDMARGVLLLLVGGLASGLLGVGGGVIIVPVYNLVMGVPMHIGVPTSLFAMMFTSVSGLTAHIQLGNLSIEHAIPLIIGTILGSQMGAYLAKRARASSLRIILALIMIIASVTILLRFL